MNWMSRRIFAAALALAAVGLASAARSQGNAPETDAGATLFVSHGAPWLLGIELYQHQPIFYDLGSLVFQTATEGGTYDASAWQSVIAECRFAGGKLTDMTLTPLQLNAEGIDGDLATRGRPSLAQSADAAAILDRLDTSSAPFGTKISRTGDTALIRPS